MQLQRSLHRTIGFCTMLFVVALFAAVLGRAATPESDFNGHYELADAKAGRAFSLDVKQTRMRAEVSFSAAMNDGSGAAPDGAGKGRIEDGVLSFDFTDSVHNEATCTLAPGRGGYVLTMTVLKVVDPGPLHFYGTVLLKKIARHPD